MWSVFVSLPFVYVHVVSRPPLLFVRCVCARPLVCLPAYACSRACAPLVQAFLNRTGFVRLRITLLTLHVLARGFLMRKQIIQKQNSVGKLQVRARCVCSLCVSIRL